MLSRLTTSTVVAVLTLACLVAVPASASGPLLAFVEHEGADPSGAEHNGDAVNYEDPPLQFQGDLALWSLVTFLVFLFVLWKFAWAPLQAGLDKREVRIRQDIAAAETARIKAQQMLAEHETRLAGVQDEVREILAEARRDAEYTKQDIINTAQQEAETTRQRAIGEIERARDQALSELFDYITRTVSEATEHVLGRVVTDSDQDRLVHEALSQLETHRRF